MESYIKDYEKELSTLNIKVNKVDKEIYTIGKYRLNIEVYNGQLCGK